MSVVDAAHVKTGMKLEIDGEPYLVVGAEHIKPGKGQAFSRLKLKNIQTGAVIEKTYKANEVLKIADFVSRKSQFLYSQGGDYYFMDNETYEQYIINEEYLGQDKYFLRDGMEVKVLLFKGVAIGVELPKAVELVVVETEPGVKGDTATGATKPAKLETGYVVQVPLFISAGDVVRIDTRTGEYVERVK
jgi:elongation factor P